MSIEAWAARWRIPPMALRDLADMLALPVASDAPTVASEAAVQAAIRLEAPSKGVRLWRNNVGALLDETGRPVRYGLANDSKALNQRLKSADLIGWRRVIIGPGLVGSTIAQFVSRECKPAGWKYTGKTEREQAQMRWAELVTLEGGDAGFATGPGSL